MNTLAYAILGLLSSRPRTGFEIAQRMKAPTGYLWAAQHSQIYPELARLAEADLVVATVIRGRGPRDTKRYAITSAGLEALADWADSPLAPEVPRNEMLLRIRSLWLTSPERAIAFVEAQRDRCADGLAALAQEKTAFIPDELVSWDQPEFFAFATLQHGVARTQAAWSWCTWLLDQLHRQQRGERGTLRTDTEPGSGAAPPAAAAARGPG
jgi:DNA-binding PadR family transcriptional regulator